MNISVTARSIAIGLIGFAGGLWFRHRALNELHMGHDLFLAAQSARFGRIVAHPPRLISWVVSGLLLAGALFGLYELIVMGAQKILARPDREKRRTDN
jgi:hypothetical protein